VYCTCTEDGSFGADGYLGLAVHSDRLELNPVLPAGAY
jgi:hypothetical protein